MEINRSNVMEVVNNAGLKPDKDYGQNFLIEPDISKRIVDSADITEGDKILEIGPGIGSLTHFIAEHQQDTTIVDIDRRMIDFLNIFYRENSKFTLVESDIRKVDVSKYTKIIGNLPYNITTELVTFLLKNATEAKKMILMCQTEAFNRFSDLSGKDYGPVSVLVHLLGNSKKLFSVKAGSFYPVPKCGSTVFEITIDSDTNRDRCLEIFALAKSLFLNRRKTLMNNLTNLVKDRTLAEQILISSQIPMNKRPEEISPMDYSRIFDEFNKVK